LNWHNFVDCLVVVNFDFVELSNSELSKALKLYADLCELHGLNQFKVRSFSSAAFAIKKMPQNLAGLDINELEKINGIGKSIAIAISEISKNGFFSELNYLIDKTPQGVMEMLAIKGIGPKKIALIWQELGIDDVGELLYACKENRLAQAKGFGLKTQDNIITQIEFIYSNKGKFLYAQVENSALKILEMLREFNTVDEISFCGEIRRKNPVLDKIELIVSAVDQVEFFKEISEKTNFEILEKVENKLTCVIEQLPLNIYLSDNTNFAFDLFRRTGSSSHLEKLKISSSVFMNEEDIYKSKGLQFVEPEMREGLNEIEKAHDGTLPVLIELKDIKGLIHNHSTWSDGLNSIAEMANACENLGYEYFGIADHSKAAFYANGLDEKRVLAQHQEIELLNKNNQNFRIFKGIECDILNDGRLDFEDEFLGLFDYVVASVHSNLKMTEEKANARLLKAIENKYTTILGHATGRLLLLRNGYPINHKLIIEACAKNNVVIEINANPYRLDLDWQWIDFAMERGVLLSINPDAHNVNGLKDIYWGILSARKGGLNKEMCLNSQNCLEISNYFKWKKSY